MIRRVYTEHRTRWFQLHYPCKLVPICFDNQLKLEQEGAYIYPLTVIHMTLPKLCTCLLFTFLFFGCLRGTHQNQQSRVAHFHYGGYSDTIYALVYGEVYEEESKSGSDKTLRPVSHVKIKAEQNGKEVFTDSQGQFVIGLEEGDYNLLVSKEGYQSLLLANYASHPDQVSDTKIILTKGSGKQTSQLPEWNRY